MIDKINRAVEKEAFEINYYADRKRNTVGYVLRFLWVLRKCHSSRGFSHFFYHLVWRRYMFKYGLEISDKCKIGKGLYIGHAFNITVNANAEIGDWCNIHKGVTIGQTNRGKKGSPKIGNMVWIGVNATIVGNIVIGDDVLIAPNSYVNIDVPSHSVVLGNPCEIHHRKNATEGYINNIPC